MDTSKKLLLAQATILFGGTIFAWSQTLTQVKTFAATHGTLLRFVDLSLPNPLTTACLYGSIAFAVALFWAVRLYQSPHEAGERRLRNFLLFGVVFAGSVVAYEAIQYYQIFGSSTDAFICTPGVPPVETPCFTGMIFFIGAFGTSLLATRSLKSGSDKASDRMPG